MRQLLITDAPKTLDLATTIEIGSHTETKDDPRETTVNVWRLVEVRDPSQSLAQLDIYKINHRAGTPATFIECRYPSRVALLLEALKKQSLQNDGRPG